MITSHQERSMELTYMLDRRRLQRELRRREAALREATEVLQAAEPKPDSLLARHASLTRGWWECDFCGRGFHGYGRFLNHNCHETD
jgi:hypothetical protein